MNQNNYEYLRDQIKYSGFGEGLEEKLKIGLQSGKPDFELSHYTKFGNDEVISNLSFTKSKQSDMYFFNSYRVDMKKESQESGMEQTFYINKGNNFTLKEAYNLMSGRAVNKDLSNKEGNLFNAWVQMDFKNTYDNGNFKLRHYHENYGYDLEKSLSRHPIRELTNSEFKASLLDSLKKGNLQSVTYQKDGVDQKVFVEANPQYKTINVYDTGMKRLDFRQKNEKSQVQDQNPNRRERLSGSDEGGPPDEGKRTRRKANSLG